MKSQNILLGIATSMSVCPLMQAQEKEQTPNIIVIMVDQMRADLVQREGYPLNTMPFTDSLAQAGTWFDKAYTAAPISGPARVSLLTGRFPKATHVRSNHNIEDAYYTEDMFDVARKQGYKTALVGKNHSHLTPQKADYWRPYGHVGQNAKDKSKQGEKFDKYLGTLNVYANMEPSPHGVEGQLPYRMVDDATQWINSLDNQPFLMWFSMSEPHNPYQTCEPYYSMFPPESLPKMRTTAADRKIKGTEYELLAEMMALGHQGYAENLQRLRSVYHGMLRLIDDQVARLIGELKRQGVYENTIIVFVSDHGDYVGEYGLMKKGAGMDDILARIPMQWTGPGIISSKKPNNAHVNMIDIFPTICEIIDAPIPMGVQGRSLWPMLQGKDYPKEEFSSVMSQDGYGGMYYTKEDDADYIAEGAVHKTPGFFDELNTWTQSGTMRMLRKDNWKLVYDMDGNGQLYDVNKDPVEMNNLFDKKRFEKVQADMVETLLKWEVATQDPLPIPRTRYRFKRNEHNYLFKQ